MPELKPFKYYAIRTGNAVIFRRTTGFVQKIKSVLYSTTKEFRLEQITYTGGRVIGCMPYLAWFQHMPGKALNKPMQLQRQQYKALDPYIIKPKERLSKPRKHHNGHE